MSTNNPFDDDEEPPETSQPRQRQPTQRQPTDRQRLRRERRREQLQERRARQDPTQSRAEVEADLREQVAAQVEGDIDPQEDVEVVKEDGELTAELTDEARSEVVSGQSGEIRQELRQSVASQIEGDIDPQEDVAIVQEDGQLTAELTDEARNDLSQQKINEIDNELAETPVEVGQEDAVALRAVQRDYVDALSRESGQQAVAEALRESGVPRDEISLEFGEFVQQVDPEAVEDVSDELGANRIEIELAKEEFQEERQQRQESPQQFIDEFDSEAVGSVPTVESGLELDRERNQAAEDIETNIRQEVAADTPGVDPEDVQADVDPDSLAQGNEVAPGISVDEEAQRQAAALQLAEQSDQLEQGDIAGVRETETGFEPVLTEEAQRERVAEGSGIDPDDIAAVQRDGNELSAELTQDARVEQVAEQTAFTEDEIAELEETDSGEVRPVLSDEARRERAAEQIREQIVGQQADDVLDGGGVPEIPEITADDVTLDESGQATLTGEGRVEAITTTTDIARDEIAALEETDSGQIEARLTEGAQRERVAEASEFEADEIADVQRTDGEIQAELTDEAREERQIDALAEETEFSEAEIVGVEETADGQVRPELSADARREQAAEQIQSELALESTTRRSAGAAAAVGATPQAITPADVSLDDDGAEVERQTTPIRQQSGPSDDEIAGEIAGETEGVSADDVVVSDGEVIERVTATNVLDDETISNISPTDIQQTDSGFTLTEQAQQREQQARQPQVEDLDVFDSDEPTDFAGQRTGQQTVSPGVDQSLGDSTLSEDINRFRADVADTPVVQGPANAVEGLRSTLDNVTDVVTDSEVTDSAIDFAQRDDVQAATLVATTAAPGVPPVNAAALRAAQAGAVGLGGVAAANIAQEELEINDRDAELNIPSESVGQRSELEAGSGSAVTEISVPEGEQQIINAGELGIPEGQVEQAEIVRGPDGAEITDDGEIIIPAEATQVARGQRFDEEEEEDDEEEEEENEDVDDEELIIIEGPTGEDFLDEEELGQVSDEVVREETEEAEEAEDADVDEEVDEIVESAIGQRTAEDDAQPDEARSDELFEEQETTATAAADAAGDLDDTLAQDFDAASRGGDSPADIAPPLGDDDDETDVFEGLSGGSPETPFAPAGDEDEQTDVLDGFGDGAETPFSAAGDSEELQETFTDSGGRGETDVFDGTPDFASELDQEPEIGEALGAEPASNTAAEPQPEIFEGTTAQPRQAPQTAAEPAEATAPQPAEFLGNPPAQTSESLLSEQAELTEVSQNNFTEEVAEPTAQQEALEPGLSPTNITSQSDGGSNGGTPRLPLPDFAGFGGEGESDLFSGSGVFESGVASSEDILGSDDDGSDGLFG